MNSLQRALFEMFNWYHDFCEQHGLRYYMQHGTLLGAVRHKGFIPWDDDIDVGMPREDLQKLERLLQENPDKRYLLETPVSSAEDYFYTFAKIYDTRTTVIENTRIKSKRGIYLDVFPLDGAGNTQEECRKLEKAIKWKRSLLLARTTGLRKGRSFWKNASIIAARTIPNIILDNKELQRNIDCECSRISFDEAAWVGDIGDQCMPARCYGTPTLYEFEGSMKYGPQMAEEYLTCRYGDWKKLPVKEKQTPHHDLLHIDLDKPYQEDE